MCRRKDRERGPRDPKDAIAERTIANTQAPPQKPLTQPANHQQQAQQQQQQQSQDAAGPGRRDKRDRRGGDRDRCDRP